jgi:Tyrosine-protein kinase ephrin type A/B receptor-like
MAPIHFHLILSRFARDVLKKLTEVKRQTLSASHAYIQTNLMLIRVIVGLKGTPPHLPKSPQEIQLMLVAVKGAKRRSLSRPLIPMDVYQPSYYSPYPSIPCAKCPAGQYSGNAELTCRNCPAGQTADSSQTGCVVLPSSRPTFRPSFKSNGCLPGQYDTGTSCQTCQPGYYSPDPSYECMPCPPRTYAGKFGMAHCQVCGDIVNLSKTMCEQCEAGSYLRRYYDQAGNETKEPICDQCQYQFGYQYWSGPNDFCHECPYDYKPNADHSGCVIDPYTYGAPSYSPTAFGSSTPPVIVPVVCERGSGLGQDSESCTPCPKSFYQDPSTFNDTYFSCRKCPPGTYTSEVGQTQCFGCPVGNSVNDDQTGCE